MRLGLMIGYSGSRIDLPLALVQEADRLGYFAVWTAEAYGSDCITPLAWLGALTETIHLGTAIMQMPARTPAMCAMTAMSLDHRGSNLPALRSFVPLVHEIVYYLARLMAPAAVIAAVRTLVRVGFPVTQ